MQFHENSRTKYFVLFALLALMSIGFQNCSKNQSAENLANLLQSSSAEFDSSNIEEELIENEISGELKLASLTPTDSDGLATAILEYSSHGASAIVIYVGLPSDPNSEVFARPALSENGSTVETGQWVSDGTTFYLQDSGSGDEKSAANTLAVLTVRVPAYAPAPSPPPGNPSLPPPELVPTPGPPLPPPGSTPPTELPPSIKVPPVTPPYESVVASKCQVFKSWMPDGSNDRAIAITSGDVSFELSETEARTLQFAVFSKDNNIGSLFLNAGVAANGSNNGAPLTSPVPINTFYSDTSQASAVSGYPVREWSPCASGACRSGNTAVRNWTVMTNSQILCVTGNVTLKIK